MSLNHILDTARKLGIPVVITNERGESPQVVMPFEDFASMVGVTGPMAGKPRVTGRVAEEVDERDEIAQALADLTMERIEEQGDIEDADLDKELASDQDDDRFLEDNFYFEPVEDKERP
jgi:hypothetical protein